MCLFDSFHEFSSRLNLQIRTHGLLSSDAELASLLVGQNPGVMWHHGWSDIRIGYHRMEGTVTLLCTL